MAAALLLACRSRHWLARMVAGGEPSTGPPICPAAASSASTPSKGRKRRRRLMLPAGPLDPLQEAKRRQGATPQCCFRLAGHMLPGISGARRGCAPERQLQFMLLPIHHILQAREGALPISANASMPGSNGRKLDPALWLLLRCCCQPLANAHSPAGLAWCCPAGHQPCPHRHQAHAQSAAAWLGRCTQTGERGGRCSLDSGHRLTLPVVTDTPRHPKPQQRHSHFPHLTNR